MTENRIIHTNGGTYREIRNYDNAQYSERDIINISEVHQKNLTEAALEIQQLLEHLDQAYDINTSNGKNAAVNEAIKQISQNSSLTQRLFSAGKAAAYTAIEKGVQHPLVAPVVAAIKDWEKTKSN